LTTANRLLAAVAARKRMRWRRDIRAILGDVGSGAESPLEVRYLRTVERAHGLPRGLRQAPRARRGGRYYDDVGYAAFGVLVELDGRLGHGADGHFRDLRRDNAAAAFTAARRPPARVVLIDDVYTTGSTAHAAASALRKAGADEVEVVTFARTIRLR